MTAPARGIGRSDAAIALLFSALGVVLMYANVQDDKASVLAIPLFLGVTLPLLWRRMAPNVALGASLAALVVHDLLFGARPIRCGVVVPIAFLLVFTAAARLERRQAVTALLFGLGLIIAESITFFGGFGVVFAAITAAVWGTGRVVRSRGEMAKELQATTVELLEARNERARMEITADRARLSSELDELLQFRLGELAKVADRGSPPGDAAEATATLAQIEQQSRRTLEQMREIVGELRDQASVAEMAPQPTLTHLDALLVRAKGPSARLTVEGGPRVLPASVELSAYRIVEQLLMALDDAPEVAVRVRFGDDALEIAVSGRARRRTKEDIARVRERVELHHGTLDSATRDGQALAVVSLPLLAGT